MIFTRFIHSIFLLLVCHNLLAQDLVAIKNFGSNPGNLNGYFHLSEHHSQDTLPLLIALHGCTQTATQLNKISGLTTLSDQYQFHLVFPEQKHLNNLNNCFNWFLEKDLEPKGGESQSIYQLIQYAIKNLPVDQQKIYVCGFSAGAEMSVILLVNYPELFQSGAVMAGGAYYGKLGPMSALSHMNRPPDYSDRELKTLIQQAQFNDSLLPPIVILHGQKDKVVNPKNSDLLLQQWLALSDDTCLHPGEIILPARYDVHKKTWTNCDSTWRVIYYTIDETGHTLAVNPGTGEKQGGHEGPFAKDIDFYCLYYVLQDFGLIPQE